MATAKTTEEIKKGRPKIKEKEKKKKRTIHLSDSEYETIKRNAKRANIPISIYIRETLLKRKPVFYGENFKAATSEINKIGLNINQIAKYVHQISGTLTPFELQNQLEKTYSLLEELKGQLKK